MSTIAVSGAHVGPAANGALVSDLLRSPGDAGRATAFLVLGGNSFGLLAPIVTGYVVQSTGSFYLAFLFTACLAVVGALSYLFVVGRVAPIDWAARRVIRPQLA